MRLSTFAQCLLTTLALGLVKAWGETPDQVAHRSRALLTDPTIFGVGILSTIYPQDYYLEELRGFVASGSDYFAPCYANGDMLVLALPVSANWKNALTAPGKNATFTVVSNPDPKVPDPRHATRSGRWLPSRPKWRRGMYSKQRLSLFGHLEPLKKDAKMMKELQKCYLDHHPDSAHFIPGSDSPHFAIWTRFVVDKVYRVGGYGDESQIGWLDMDQWQRAGRKSSTEWYTEWDDLMATSTSREESQDAHQQVSSARRIASLFSDNDMGEDSSSQPLVFQTPLA